MEVVRFRASWFVLPLLLTLPLLGAGLPQADVATSKRFRSVEEAIGAVYVSKPHPFKSSCSRVLADTDLIKLESGIILDFAHRRGKFSRVKAPAEHLRIIAVRYTLGAKEVKDALVEAKSLGVGQVHFVTDLNESLRAEYAGDEKESTEFAEAAFREGVTAQTTEELLAAGFGFNDPRYGIYSQPLWRTRDDEDARTPIMHLKELYLVVDDEHGNPVEVYSYYGTANMSGVHRYNRIVEETDFGASLYGLRHAERMIKHFRDGNEKGERKISSLPRANPLRLTYEDGSFQEIAYTDGRDNWNERIARLIETGNVVDFLGSHFVVTFGEAFDALVKKLKSGRYPFELFLAADDKFCDPHEWGLAPALAGFHVSRPFGKSVHGVSSKYRNRLHLYNYQRLVDGAVETTLKGAPNHRHLWHDKTTMIIVEEDGEQWAYLFTGSFNLSGNKANAERQVMYRIRASSALVRGIRESVVEVVKNDPDHALFMDKGVLRNVTSQMLGHSLFEIPVATNDRMIEMWQKGSYDQLERELLALAQKVSKMTDQPDAETKRKRIAQLMAFARWYASPKVPTELKKRKFLSIQDAVAVMMAITFEKDSPIRTWQDLDSVFFQPKPPDEQEAYETLMNEYIEKAWTEILHLEKEMPDDQAFVEAASWSFVEPF